MLINSVDLEESDIFFHIDFEMIRVATDDFSEENKLGEGGFGPVYKVITDYLIKRRNVMLCPDNN